MFHSQSICQPQAGQIFLAPMEGVIDALMRNILTSIGDYDYAITPFVRVTNNRLPWRRFRQLCPELCNQGRTLAGTPVIVQLLGCNPKALAASATHLARLSPAGIDLNLGCPAAQVNRHGAGAALLDDPEKIAEIVSAVRAAIPASIPFSTKIRLGIRDPSRAVACAEAIEAAGADYLVVHARTQADGYKFPARWEFIARIREALDIPVIANGDIDSVAAYDACLSQTGCQGVMLGRHAVANPFLICKIRQHQGIVEQQSSEREWQRLLPHLAWYWQEVRTNVTPRHAPGRMKLWLTYLRQNFPEAAQLYQALRTAVTLDAVESVLGTFRVPLSTGRHF